MREAREKDKADIVPTPYFLSASSGNWKCNIINMTDDNILTCYSCFLVSILSKCPNQSLSATKVNIKNAFITYMEMGKSCAIDRNFQYENFINEARNTLENQGLSVDVRHIMLVADIMTSEGEVKSIGRHGISGEKSSVLARAAFEETGKHLLRASIRGEVDDLTGIIENIIIGQPIPLGTGSIGVKMANKNE